MRALFSLYSAVSIQANVPNTKLYLKLFDALIKPILLYGCEVWGPHISQTNNIITKFVNKFYRILLGVPKHTSTAGVHAELGRFPIDINVHDFMLKYWFRLISLPSSRLVSHCYWSLYDQHNCSDSWLESIKSIIYSSGQCFIWNNQKEIGASGQFNLKRHQAYLSQNLKDQASQHLFEKIQSESKLHLFKTTKDVLCLSNHLSKIPNKEARSYFSKLRLGVLPLEVEKGRGNDLMRADRCCKLCNSQQVEDEVHFLFECPALVNERAPFIANLAFTLPSFHLLTNTQKLKNIFFNELSDSISLEKSSNFLVRLFNARKVLLDAQV